MSRKYFLIGACCLGIALFLSLISSISLPYLPALDYARVKFSVALSNGAGGVKGAQADFRWGIWGACAYDTDGKRTCEFLGHGYESGFIDPTGQIVLIAGSWTRGLAIHPVVTAVIAIAVGLAVAKWEHGTLAATLTSALAALMLLIAFAIDIALFAFVHHQVGKLKEVNGNVNAGTAFWFTLVELVLCIIGAVMVLIGRRSDSGGDAYPMFSNQSGGFLSRFKK
ncbi:hypothetical protein HMN09_00142200 [Mycena chlorophos]|uniref:Pali-domain-containing protein n=1 Tax=Mycena chlorophos TaxID=658473 RepID=A0A8H6WJ71_MYCCL|nr:hypothetical protein HMN09_00142200 [Mycena chlorophos]